MCTAVTHCSETATAAPSIRSLSAGADTAPARRQVDDAKRALGERGPPWWQDGSPDFNRRMVANTPYAEWYAGLDAASGPSAEAAPSPTGE